MWRPNWQQAKVVERVHLLHGLEHNAALRAIAKKAIYPNTSGHIANSNTTIARGNTTAIQTLPEAQRTQKLTP